MAEDKDTQLTTQKDFRALQPTFFQISFVTQHLCNCIYVYSSAILFVVSISSIKISFQNSSATRKNYPTVNRTCPIACISHLFSSFTLLLNI